MQENQGFVRGHRAESGIIDWPDCKITKKEIDDALEPFILRGSKAVEKEIYVSSKTE